MYQEFRHAIRTLKASPSFTSIALVILALGIGATTAMFSVVDGVLLRPLDYPNAERILQLNTSRNGRVIPRLTGPDLADINTATSTLEQIGMYYGGEMGVQLPRHADFASTYFVTPNFFSVFGAAPALGRAFILDDARRGAVIGASLAERNFGSRTSAIGQTLRVEGVVYEIVGIMPERFRFPNNAEVWLAMEPTPVAPWGVSRTAYNYRAVALARRGTPIERVATDLTAIAARLQAGFPETNTGKTFIGVPLQEQLVGPVRATLYFLMGAVSLVLAIACANVANLLLARATARQREIAVRAALGASRFRIVRQLLVESAVIALAGGALGSVLAFAGTRILTRATAQQVGLPRLADIGMSWPLFVVALATSLAATVIFTLMPAWQATRIDSTHVLKQAGRGVAGLSGRTRNALVVVQVALSLALAIGAGLLFRSFVHLTQVDLGFSTDRLLVMYAHRPARTLAEYLEAGRFLDSAVERVRQISGVTSAAAAMGVPTGQYGSNGGYAVDGQDFRPGGKMPQAIFSLAGPEYFSTMGIPLRRGRDFTTGDGYDRPFVAIISESLARQSFPGQDPIGHTILCGLDGSPKWMTIVGVVADTRQDSPTSSLASTLYMPLLQHPFHGNEIQVVMRTALPSTSLIEPVRVAMQSLDRETAIKFTTMDDMVSNAIATPRLRTMVIALFAGLALLLALAGMYGVMTYVTIERIPEFAVRIALGASPGGVLGLVLRRAAWMAATGIVLGVALAYSAARVMNTMLFGLTATDASTYAWVLLVVTPLVMMAAAIPAWRAARRDPLAALRNE